MPAFLKIFLKTVHALRVKSAIIGGNCTAAGCFYSVNVSLVVKAFSQLTQFFPYFFARDCSLILASKQTVHQDVM